MSEISKNIPDAYKEAKKIVSKKEDEYLDEKSNEAVVEAEDIVFKKQENIKSKDEILGQENKQKVKIPDEARKIIWGMSENEEPQETKKDEKDDIQQIEEGNNLNKRFLAYDKKEIKKIRKKLNLN